ncbi:MAG: hypothetical protein D4R67_03000 [Bacteroidetes bacterium]|nr:MAG: hypothetical protein D4R67_03000 [Bacteroidota bacterium]
MKARNTKGQFVSGNPGKPKGAKNKVTSEQKERIEKVLELIDETLEEDLLKMKPKERVDLWAALQEYIRPKLQRTHLEVDANEEQVTKITFEVIGSSTPPPAPPHKGRGKNNE